MAHKPFQDPPYYPCICVLFYHFLYIVHKQRYWDYFNFQHLLYLSAFPCFCSLITLPGMSPVAITPKLILLSLYAFISFEKTLFIISFILSSSCHIHCHYICFMSSLEHATLFFFMDTCSFSKVSLLKPITIYLGLLKKFDPQYMPH